VTLVVAFVWGPGVVVSADTRVSGPVVYGEERKVDVVRVRMGDGRVLTPAVVAGAGDGALVKQSFTLVEQTFRRILQADAGGGGQPDAAGLDQAVAAVEDSLIQRYRSLREAGLEPDTSLLLASVTREGEPRLYAFDSRGLAEPRHTSPGYAMLGKGALTGGQLILSMLGYEPSKTWDLGLLSAFLIDAVSTVDPSVSPFWDPRSSVYIRLEGSEVVAAALTEEATRDTAKRVAERKALIRMLWDTLEQLGDTQAEQAVSKALGKLTAARPRRPP